MVWPPDRGRRLDSAAAAHSQQRSQRYREHLRLHRTAERRRRHPERFARQLNGQCRRLAQLPGTIGRARPELRPDIRSAPFYSYIIFFRYIGTDLFEVVRVIEGHRDIAALFSGADD